ncbi:MAG: uridine kinase [Planctomycetota bacterium]
MKTSEQSPRVMAIAGGSGSGKSTFIRQLTECVGKEHVAIVAIDDYYHDLSHLEPEKRAEFNFDSLEAIDFSLFGEHLDALRSDEPVPCPTYDFSTHCRGEVTRTVEPADWILVDGIMALASTELRARYDWSIFLKVSEETRFERRLQRDMVERGRSKESVFAQWEATVAPFHDQVIEPSSEHADLVVQCQDFQFLVEALGRQMLESRL